MRLSRPCAGVQPSRVEREVIPIFQVVLWKLLSVNDPDIWNGEFLVLADQVGKRLERSFAIPEVDSTVCVSPAIFQKRRIRILVLGLYTAKNQMKTLETLDASANSPGTGRQSCTVSLANLRRTRRTPLIPGVNGRKNKKGLLFEPVQ